MRALLPAANPLATALAAAAGLLLTAGCARPYYYQPAYPPMPVQTLQPGQPYVPGQGYNGGFVAPGGAVQPGGLQPIPSNGAPPPTYDNGGGTSGGGTSSGSPYYEDNGQPYNPSVPDSGYQDPNTYGNPSDDFLSPDMNDLNEASNPKQPVGLTPAAGEINLAAAPQEFDVPQPFDATPADLTTPMKDAAVQPAAATADDPFAINQMSHETPATGTTRAGSVEPYAFDADGYTWLRGIISFDHTEQVWSITYDTTPDTWDSYAGHLTLVGAIPQDIRDNEVVLVEGAVDAATHDRLGKPVYRVAKVTPLEPAGP